MLLSLSPFSLFCLLLLLLPQAVQSSRARFLPLHPRHHAHQHHHISPPSHISSTPRIHTLTGSNQKLHEHAQLDIAMVTASVQEFGGMLDTPVSGPNPGGNTQNLAVSGLGNMLNTQVSAGPNPSGNANTMAGPNPGGNSKTLILGSMLDTPVSGPSPGGNSEGLYVSSAPNSGSNSKKSLVDKPLASEDVVSQRLTVSPAAMDDHSKLVLTGMLDTSVSGPNPGGNSASLGDMLSGPNPGGNSVSLTSSDDAARFFSGHAAPIDQRGMVSLSAVSGPNPGGNSASLGSSKLHVSTIERFAQSVSSKGSKLSRKPEAFRADGVVFGELPRAPVPPSGPNPTHNDAVTNQGLFAERKLRGPELIGCEQDGEDASGADAGFSHGHLGTFINAIHGMGAVRFNAS